MTSRGSTLVAGLVLAGAVLACDGDESTEQPRSPLFPVIPDAWVNRETYNIMTGIWAGHGVDAAGTNHWTIARPQRRTFAERFAPESRYFQAWFGAYTVFDTAKERSWGIGPAGPELRLIGLFAADQRSWLQVYGDPVPLAEVRDAANLPMEETTRLGHPAWRVSAEMITHLDVGDYNPTRPEDVAFVLAYEYDDVEFDASGLVVPRAAWAAEVASYQQVTLVGELWAWYCPVVGKTHVIYGNGVRFDPRSGESRETYPLIRDEVRALAAGIRCHR
ncbi:MAG: hypothetical protein HYV63_19065 [Candidatus Schekmanbacteria bacterium]|nr:hypothetical protein [Candidatus Schekmanbacteria bacterium]